jgi:hypothetical protein
MNTIFLKKDVIITFSLVIMNRLAIILYEASF